jgi:prephenate dehydrogenase
VKSSVAIVGCGLIGGSLALRLQEAGDTVVIWDSSESVRSQATSRGLRAAASLTDAVNNVDIVVLATPPNAVIPTGLDVAELISARTVVTDVGSVKTSISSTLMRAYADVSRVFVPGHPMAGIPVSGFGGAISTLFDNCTWVLCDESLLIRSLAERAGASHVVVRDPREHDRQVATISHVPQLAVSAVAASLSKDEWRIVDASPVLREALRLSTSPYDLWHAIVSANTPAIASELSLLQVFAETQEPGDDSVASLIAAMSTALVAIARDEDALELAGPGFRSATCAMDAAMPDFSRFAQALKSLEDLNSLEDVFAKAHEGP